MAALKAQRDQAAELTRRDMEIERLKKELAREHKWKTHEDTHNITQEQYTGLAENVPGGAVHYMTDTEALDWICSEFGFDHSKVTILHEINKYEINRYHRLCRTGKKIDRRLVYAPQTTTFVSASGAAPPGCGGLEWPAPPLLQLIQSPPRRSRG